MKKTIDEFIHILPELYKVSNKELLIKYNWTQELFNVYMVLVFMYPDGFFEDTLDIKLISEKLNKTVKEIQNTFEILKGLEKEQ